MLKYNCIIVEDEPLASEILTDYIAQIPFLELLGVCMDAVFALDLLRQQKVDLLFLDIHLPKLKGLDFLQSLVHPPQVIVTSAYPEYALQSYELNVIDYLLKPVRFSRFLKAVDKFTSPASMIAVDAGHQHKQTENDYFFFPVGKKKIRIFIKDILYCESYREYIKVFTQEQIIITKYPLTEIATILSGKNFLRIHRSFLVARDKVSAYSSYKVEINGKELPIGRNYKELVINVLNGSGKLQ